MKGAVIMAKSASVYARIDPMLKEQAENILSALGIPTSNAIDMFFKQIVLKKGLPFEVRLPYEKPVCLGTLSEEELNAELEKGYADLQAGRTKPIEQAISEMRSDFKI
jgi:DNA-damage-inducible protein J